MTADPGHLLGARLAAEHAWLRLLLLHLSGRHVRSHVDADDLVQEVFLRVLQASPPTETDGAEAFRRFLAVVARHTVIDVARSLRAARRRGATVRLERSAWSRCGVRESAVVADTLGPATRVADQGQRDALHAAFLRLSGEHRRVIGLRQFEGVSAEEAGRRMGRSASAVHSLYRRALQAWRAEAGPLEP